MYEIYYQTSSGFKLVGKTDKVETVAHCTFALNHRGWKTEVFYVGRFS